MQQQNLYLWSYMYTKLLCTVEPNLFQTGHYFKIFANYMHFASYMFSAVNMLASVYTISTRAMY